MFCGQPVSHEARDRVGSRQSLAPPEVGHSEPTSLSAVTRCSQVRLRKEGMSVEEEQKCQSGMSCVSAKCYSVAKRLGTHPLVTSILGS